MAPTSESPTTSSERSDSILRNDEIFIAVMGMTGAGKSSFISLCTQEPLQKPEAGHSLESCTSTVTIHTMTLEQQTIHLLDTPGFDDTRRSDAEILQEIAYWLLQSHQSGIKLSGIVYLHRITDLRLQGSALRGLRMFKQICGSENYGRVVLATTMWDELPLTDENAHQHARMRELELWEKEEFWGDMRRQGAISVRISPGRYHALNIIRHFARDKKQMTLALQRQMSVQTPLHETDAGKILYDTMRLERLQVEEELRGFKQYADSSLVTHKSQRQKEIRETVKILSQDLEKRNHQVRLLQAGIRQLETDWNQRLQVESHRIATKSAEKQQDDHGEIVYDDENSSLFRERAASWTPHHTNRKDASASKTNLQHFEGERVERTSLHRLASRKYYPTRNKQTHATAVGVVGTGIAVAQLLAALACTVM